jgi:hypothetical protein
VPQLGDVDALGVTLADDPPPLPDELLAVELEPPDVLPHAASAMANATAAHSQTIGRERRPRAAIG